MCDQETGKEKKFWKMIDPNAEPRCSVVSQSSYFKENK